LETIRILDLTDHHCAFNLPRHDSFRRIIKLIDGTKTLSFNSMKEC